MNYLIIMRHGQSQWNLENRFTGWEDVDLTPAGEDEARRYAAERLPHRRRVFLNPQKGPANRRDGA